MTPGELWQRGKLVRIVAPGFVAGLIIDPDTGRAVVVAPILGWARGQHEDKLRQSFHRLGWRATIVQRKTAEGQTHGG